MAAKHIQIAQSDGPKAGFNAWIEMMERSGLPQVQDRLAEVRAQGNKKAQFEYYCNVYGKQIFGKGPKAVTHEDQPQDTGAEGDVFALFQRFMESIGGKATTPVSDEDDSLDDVDEDAVIERATGAKGTRKETTKRASTRKSTESDDPFAPRNPEDDATSGRLWRLNELGLLRIVDKPSKPISNGQAHSILKARL